MFTFFGDSSAVMRDNVQPSGAIIKPTKTRARGISCGLLMLNIWCGSDHSLCGHEQTFIPWHMRHVPRLPEQVLIPPHGIIDKIVLPTIYSPGRTSSNLHGVDLGLINHVRHRVAKR